MTVIFRDLYGNVLHNQFYEVFEFELGDRAADWVVNKSSTGLPILLFADWM